MLRVWQGQEVRISPDSAPLLSIPGTVREVSPLAVQTADAVRYRVAIDFDDRDSAPGGASLRQGLSTRVEIVVSRQSDVLSVPIEAVSLTESGRVVQVVRADETTEPRIVQLGQADGVWVVVTSGVQEGETVPRPERPDSPVSDNSGCPGKTQPFFEDN